MPVAPVICFYFLLFFRDPFQLRNSFADILQHFFEFLIAAHIFPQRIYIHFLLIQDIRIHEVLDVVNWFEGQCLGNQGEELVLDPAES